MCGTLSRIRKSQVFDGGKLLFLLVLMLFVSSVGLSQVVNSGNDVHIDPEKKDPAAPTKSNGVKPEDVDLNKLGDRPISVDVNLVLVPVTVTDPMNRLVTGLDRDNFAIFEGSNQQQIKTFSSEDEPITVGVIFDMSGSMGNKIDKAKQAVIEFFKTANPQDEFFLIAFNDRPELVADFTSSIEDIQGKLVYPMAKGRTALLDAVYLGMNKMRNAKYQKKALLIISDGGDNRSRYTDSEIKNMIKEADVMIYSIGLFDVNAPTAEEKAGPYLLNEISDATGGRLFRIDDVSELSDTAAKIGIELRNQYVIGYRPVNANHDGKWRKIKVKLLAPKGLPQLIVHAKTGYYAPAQ
jgi:Ca-activated chloride channel family protein